MTIRERIAAISSELAANADNLTPARASAMQNELSALIGNCNTEFRKTEMAYKRRFFEIRQGHKTSAAARIEAETTDEYERRLEAQLVKEQCESMLVTLRQFLRTAVEEMRLER